MYGSLFEKGHVYTNEILLNFGFFPKALDNILKGIMSSV
jgi:hypothetical protein